MGNCFQNMIQDVFNIQEFIDYFYPIENDSSDSSDSSSSLQGIVCIQYTSEQDAIYTEFGVDQNIDFILTCKVKDFTPKKNQKIKYHDKTYKIISWKTDGFNLTHNLNIKSITSK